ncbi:MAG: hypothetical protein IKI50_06565 [Clostridia bacterium]|nr:hypothetical protein [Clostridia bacterium]
MKKREGKKRPVVPVVALILAGAALIGGIVYAVLKDTTAVVDNTLLPATVSCNVVETFNGTTKTNVKLENTGDIPAYLRAKVVINWVDADGNVAYKPSTAYAYAATMASPLNWTNGSNSSLLTEGYWYYNGIVQPGEQTDVLIASIAENLSPSVSANPQYHLQVTILAEALQAAPASAVAETWHMAFNGTSWVTA